MTINQGSCCDLELVEDTATYEYKYTGEDDEFYLPEFSSEWGCEISYNLQVEGTDQS